MRCFAAAIVTRVLSRKRKGEKTVPDFYFMSKFKVHSLPEVLE